jgi:glutamine synthetase adenylyltransferase
MTQPVIRDLLLASRLDQKQVVVLLAPFGFKYPERADANLQAMTDDPAARQLLANILEELLACASRSADPDQSISYLERFARAALNRTRLFTYLAESPRTLEILRSSFEIHSTSTGLPIRTSSAAAEPSGRSSANYCTL